MSKKLEKRLAAAALAVVEILKAQSRTVSCCESLTAGLVCSAIAGIPGASAVLRGGLVTYATDTKNLLAGVDSKLLDDPGPVSAIVAKRMASGVRHEVVTDWGVSLTGVAGPDSLDGHPVGEVWVGFSDFRGRAVARQAHVEGYGRYGMLAGHSDPVLLLDGDRRQIRLLSAIFALETLSEFVVDSAPQP